MAAALLSFAEMYAACVLNVNSPSRCIIPINMKLSTLTILRNLVGVVDRVVWWCWWYFEKTMYLVLDSFSFNFLVENSIWNLFRADLVILKASFKWQFSTIHVASSTYNTYLMGNLLVIWKTSLMSILNKTGWICVPEPWTWVCRPWNCICGPYILVCGPYLCLRTSQESWRNNSRAWELP